MEVKFASRPIKLIGEEPTIKVGDEFREALLSNSKLEIVKLEDYFKTDIVILSTFPSINTKTCELQTVNMVKEYSQRKDLTLINISEDLPFAQSKWCASENSKDAIVLSDYNLRDFGNKYGLLLNGLNLLARSIILFVNKKVVYFDLVEEVANNVDFKKLEEELKKYTK